MKHLRTLTFALALGLALAALSSAAFAAYDAPDTAYDLSAKFNQYDRTKYQYRNMLFDPDRGDVYLTTYGYGYCGSIMLMRYDTDTDSTTSNINNCYNPCKSYPNTCAAFSLTLDDDSDIIYMGSRGTWWGGLHSYDLQSGIFHNAISGGAPTWNRSWQKGITGNMAWKVAYDPNGMAVYLGGSRWDSPGGDFFRYNTQDGTSDNLTYDLYALWGWPTSWDSNNLYATVFDAQNNIVYTGGNGAKLARYNTPNYAPGTHAAYPDADTAYQIDLSATSWGSDTVYTMLVDPADGSLYLTSPSGKFARLSIGASGTYSLTDLTPAIAPASGTNYILNMVLAGDDIYFAAMYGRFLRFNIPSGEGTDLSDRIASFWNEEPVTSVAWDSNNNVVYLGGGHGKFARYNPLSVVDATVNIDPDTLNRKSRSAKNALTAYIEVPGYDVSEIDIATVTLTGPLGSVAAQLSPSALGDHDGDGEADLMVKFNRQDVIAIVEPGQSVELEVSGSIGNMTFSGIDAIRVIK